MNAAEQLPVTDFHAEQVRRTEKNCNKLREALSMPTGFAAWFDKLPEPVRKVLWRVAKIDYIKGGKYHKQYHCRPESKFCSPAELDRLEVVAHRMKKHFEGLS